MSAEIAKALSEVQANLPTIVKGETAKVPTKDGGSYSYTYADLADITDEVFPLLAKHGLAFIAMPTVTDTGAFVLAYSLLHTSGEREDGSYPLPANGTPQQVGSAITYARRYCLCAAVGVAPEDDDGRAAEQAARQPAQASPEPKKDSGGGRACAVCGDDLAGASVAKTDAGYVHRDGCAGEVKS